MLLPQLKSKFSIYCVQKILVHNRNISRRAVEIPELYGDEASPPVRFVLMTASILNTKLHFHNIDLFKGGNKSGFYKNITPLEKVPALKVGNTVITDSHAIALYLCNMQNNQDLYPSDALQKAKVDNMLFFNACVLFPIDSAIFTDYFAGKWPAEKHYIDEWYKSMGILEELLRNNQWLSGEKISLADFCCAATVTSLQLIIPTLDKQKLVKNWIHKLQELPCFEINTRGLKRLNEYVQKVGLL